MVKNKKDNKSPKNNNQISSKNEENDDWIVDDGPLDEDIRQEVKRLAYNLGRSHSKQFFKKLNNKK